MANSSFHGAPENLSGAGAHKARPYTIPVGARLVRARSKRVILALALSCTSLAWASDQPTVGILLHDYSAAQNQVGHFLLDRLPKSGIKTIGVAYADFTKEARLDPAHMPVLVLPESAFFPAFAAKALHRYLQSGGHLIALGGDPFAELLVPNGNRWGSFAEFAARAVVESPSFCIADPEKITASKWKADRKNLDAPSTVRVVAEAGRKAFLLEHRSVQNYDGFFLKVDPMPAGANALLFYAKADDYTPQTVLQVRTKNNALYEYVIEVRPDWAPVFAPLREFRGLGQAKDKPLVAAEIAQIGFVMTQVRHWAGDHDVFIGSVHGIELPPGMGNKIETGAFVLCEERDVYRFNQATATVPCAGAPIEGFSAEGIFSGLSALGFPSYGSSRFVPLLEARDAYGRRQGWAGGLMLNEKGRWKNSWWAIFGIEEDSWYLDERFADYTARLCRFMMKQDSPSAKTAEPVARSKKAKGAVPLPRITVQNGAFTLPDGKPFFAIGQNLGGNLYDRPLGRYDAPSLELLFRQLQEAGVNVLRILNIDTFVQQDALDLLCNAAERHGVYLLVGATDYPKANASSKKQIQQHAGELAKYFKDKSVLLGYDLLNEPYVHNIAAYKNDRGKTLAEVHGFSKANFQQYTDSLPVVEGHNVIQFSAFTELLSRPSDKELAKAFDAANGIYGEWIGWFKEAFHKAGDTHPITVGYNMWYAALPCNRQLDFINHHAYVMPTKHDYVMEQITVLDRLHAFFPDQPVTFGEFGYSNGYIVKGKPLSAQGQAVGEMLHILYTWAKGYSGAFDWQVFDYDPVQYGEIAEWSADSWLFKQNYERFHGIYTWDGTADGLLKPAGMATRFFSEAVGAGMARGGIVVSKAETQIGTGFVFQAPTAIFVGGLEHRDDLLTFVSKEELVLGLYRTTERLVAQATGDVMITLSGDELTRLGLPLIGAAVAGKNGGWKWTGNSLEVQLLAGEKIQITPPSAEKK